MLLRMSWVSLVVMCVSLCALGEGSSQCNNIEVCFTPGGQCTQSIVRVILQAKYAILVQAYAFTSRSIAKALSNASKRGVQVRVILDDRQYAYDTQALIRDMQKAGVLVWRDRPTATLVRHGYVYHKVGIAHNKVMIVDDEKVITGSFNFTYAAQHFNAENMLIITSPAVAARYRQAWQQRFAHVHRVAKALS